MFEKLFFAIKVGEYVKSPFDYLKNGIRKQTGTKKVIRAFNKRRKGWEEKKKETVRIEKSNKNNYFFPVLMLISLAWPRPSKISR